MISKTCLLCHQTTEQVKILLFNLKKKLILLFNNYSPSYKQNPFKQQNNHSFNQLLKGVFSSKQFKQIELSKCSHFKVHRYLKRKLKCDSQAFSVVCYQLYMKLAQRNYQFQIISSQIKSISERAEASFKTYISMEIKEPVNNETRVKSQQDDKASKNLSYHQVKQSDKVQIDAYKQLKQIAQQRTLQQMEPQQQLKYIFPYGYFYPFGLQ